MPVIKYENFLSESLYEETIHYMEWNLKENKDSALRTNILWGDHLVEGSFPVLTFKIGKQNPQLADKIREEIYNKIDVIKEIKFFGVVGHYWTKLSYIPWHDDSSFFGGLTIFLNRNWDENYGGYFLYKESDEVKAILPQKNLAVFQYNRTKHCTTPVNINGNIRYTLQIFFPNG